MEWKKIKNIILLVLLLLNLFLLALVVMRNREAVQNRQAIEENIGAVMEESGIVLKLDSFPDERMISALRVHRDTVLEQKVVAALLGTAEAEDLGGGLSAYSGDRGVASFRNNGEFSLLLEPGMLQLEGDPEKVVWQLLKAMGIQGDKESLNIVEGDGVLQVSVRQLVAEYPVFDCYITFRWEEDGLRSVFGRRVSGEGKPVESEAYAMSAATALLRFLADIKKAGDISSEINAMTLGYRFSNSLSDTLDPFWLLSTDTGLYYINAASGETNKVS